MPNLHLELNRSRPSLSEVTALDVATNSDSDFKMVLAHLGGVARRK
jgi:hypothetical protein